MPQSTFSVRMDEGLKRQFDILCADFGMTASTAINVFARTVVRERKIPFEISAERIDPVYEDAKKAFSELRRQARNNGSSGMTLEEINAEIARARLKEGE